MPAIILIVPVLSVVTLILVVLLSWKLQQFDPHHHFFISRVNNALQLFSGKLSVHIRLYVFVTALVWGIGVVGYLYLLTASTDLFYKGLVRIYGFTSLFLLFLTLTPGILRIYFPHFILDSLLVKSRRALGISTYFFALTHGLIAFFYYYQGSLQKVYTLSVPFQIAFYFAVTALFIFTVLVITSTDKLVGRLTFQRWKILHRFVYLAFLLSVLHTFLRGTHLQEPYITFTAFMVYLSLTFILLEIGATTIFVINHTLKTNLIRSYLIFGLLFIVGFAAFYLSILKLDQLY